MQDCPQFAPYSFDVISMPEFRQRQRRPAFSFHCPPLPDVFLLSFFLSHPRLRLHEFANRSRCHAQNVLPLSFFTMSISLSLPSPLITPPQMRPFQLNI
jgi:hypothetical protein